MKLELNLRKWRECSGNKLWAMNLRRPNFVAQDDECHRRGGNQAPTKFYHVTQVILQIWSFDQGLVTLAFL